MSPLQKKQKKITLAVDLISPFGYMAYYLTRHSPAFHNIPITYIPILLGGVMNTVGSTPPLSITNKKDWINLERTRWAQSLKIPISETVPQSFPQSTVAAMRTLCYIQETYSAEKLTSALDALFEAFWVQGKSPIASEEILSEVLGPVFGGAEEVGKILESGKGDAAKAKLKANSEWAVKDGAFGLPWFRCENEEGRSEAFWGVDHIGQVLEFLGVEVRGEAGRYRAML